MISAPVVPPMGFAITEEGSLYLIGDTHESGYVGERDDS